MKSLWISMLIAMVALASGVIGAGMHEAVFKSFSSSGGECSQYLNNDGTGECNVHCLGLVNHNWNDTVAKFSRNYANFFIPDPEDSCNQNRTFRCLEQVYSSVPVYNKCLRAQQAGQCFYDQYGQLDASSLHYVPMTNLQYTRVLLECAAMLGMSDDQMANIAKQGGFNTSDGACLLRCTLLRMGLWSDANGFDLGRSSVQCGIYSETSEVLDCQAKVLAEECDKCVQVKRVAQECLKMYYLVNRDENGNVGVEIYISAAIAGQLDASLAETNILYNSLISAPIPIGPPSRRK